LLAGFEAQWPSTAQRQQFTEHPATRRRKARFKQPKRTTPRGCKAGDFVVAVIAFAFFQGRSRACKRAIAPLGYLAMETFVCRATRSSGSPRNSRPTSAILR